MLDVNRGPSGALIGEAYENDCFEAMGNGIPVPQGARWHGDSLWVADVYGGQSFGIRPGGMADTAIPSQRDRPAWHFSRMGPH